MRLSEVYDPRANSINAVRLGLAVAVIFWHSFPLSGRAIDFAPARQLVSSVWVDGFFAISGFLITGSWLRRPKVGAFLKARILRIFPGYWMCLIVTAFVFAQIAFFGQVTVPEAGRYVIANAFLFQREYDISGTPRNVPFPGTWNGSLWTLRWEFLCYLGVLLLGVLGLLVRRWTTLVIAAAAWSLSVAAAAGKLRGVSIPNVTLIFGRLPLDDLARFVLMFACGALVYHYAHRLPVGWMQLTSSCVIVAASSFLPDYRLVAAPFLAYALIAAGAMVKHSRLRLRNDVSYGIYIYAFPVQQMLALTGAVRLHPGLFGIISAVATFPFALASWFGVERLAMRLNSSRTSKRS